MQRETKYVTVQQECAILLKLGNQLLADGLHAGNVVIVTVSTDYSSFVGQYLRHALSYEREICEGFGIDVPYPDQVWDDVFVKDLRSTVINHDTLWCQNNKKLLLVEAGVIRGGNYTYVVDYLSATYNNQILTLTMYENTESGFKSDYVGEYYNNSHEDLTFWWEQDNKHWDNC